MEQVKQKTGLLYSPRQIEIATYLTGPVSAIYMLVKNYNILEQHRISRNVKYIGAFVFVIYAVIALYFPFKVPFPILQGIPVLFVWAVLKKYHMTKEEIIMLSPFSFRSNWSVLLLCVPAFIVTVGIISVLLLPSIIYDGGQSTIVYKDLDKSEGSYKILEISPPYYDPLLRAQEVEGWVVVEFSLDEGGKVDSAKVHEESPTGVFSQAAIESVKKSTFIPAKKDGLNQRTESAFLKLRFQMAKDDSEEITCYSSFPFGRLTSCSQVQ